MLYLTKLIDKLDDIEDNFNVINWRIIEFWKSIDNEYLDFWLIKKYEKILIEYLNFIKDEKKNLWKWIDEDSKIEFSATKKLVETRLDQLLALINSVLIKVKKISQIKKDSIQNEKIEESFEWLSQMENLESLLLDFKNELKIYKKFQKLLWIKIDLNDEIEKEIENNNSKESMILIQKNFVEETSDFLEEIYDSKMKRYIEISKRDDQIFYSIKTEKAYDDLFTKNFNSKYTVWLKLEWAGLYSDYMKYQKFNENLDLILDISTFCNDYELNLSNAKIYWLEKLIYSFSDINEKLKKNILNKNDFDLNEIILYIDKEFWVYKLKALFDFFDSFWDLLEVYRSLKTIDFNNINDFYESWFAKFFSSNEIWENIISKIIKNSSYGLVLDFAKNEINFDNLLDNTNEIRKIHWSEIKSFLSNEKIKLDILFNAVLLSNKEISYYNYPWTLKSLKASILNHFKWYYMEYMYSEFILYYNQAARNRYRSERQRYLAAKRASRYNSSYWSWGYSSWGWGWSSWWSSSWSSSYSSSGSSSW